jgi:Helicase associated domain
MEDPKKTSTMSHEVVDDEQWNKMFKRLLKFHKKHGSCNVPRNFIADPKLGQWCVSQRTRLSRNFISRDQKKKLDSIGFVWKTSSGGGTGKAPGKGISTANATPKAPANRSGRWNEQWNEMYNQLVMFRQEHGHLNGKFEVVILSSKKLLWAGELILSPPSLSSAFENSQIPAGLDELPTLFTPREENCPMAHHEIR